MQGFLRSFTDLLDRLNQFTLAQCGNCGNVAGVQIKDRSTLERGLARLFVVRPLEEDEDSQAVQATHRGSRLLHEGRIEESLRELHEAKRLVPRSHIARSNLGCAYFERGDEEASLHWYREAHRAAPDDEMTTRAMALMEQRAGNMGEAQWLLLNYLQEVDSAHTGVLRQLASLYQDEGQSSQAAGCFRRLVEVDPGNSEWQKELQKCLDKLPNAPDHDDASWGDVRPTPTEGGAVAGPPLASASGPGASKASPRHGAEDLARTPPPFSAHDGARQADGHAVGMPTARSSTPTRASVPAAIATAEADRLRESGRPDAALAAYRTVLRADRTNYEALRGIADSLWDLGQYDAAIEAAKQLFNMRPDSAETNLLMAELLLSAGRPAYMAGPYLQRAAAAPVTDQALQLRLLCATAEAALSAEDYKKAMASAMDAVHVNASDSRALILLADARIHVADYEAALRALATALDALRGSQGPEVMRRCAVAHMLMAQAQERLRRYPQAFTEVQRALEFDPHMIGARIVRATALQQSGRNAEASSELEDVLKQDPSNTAALLRLGYVQLTVGDHHAASDTLEAAVSGTSASRSILGTAKIYLAMALEDSIFQLGGGGPTQRAEQVLSEGLASHQNLQCVWRDIKKNFPTDNPLSAVQALRCICDLDLTTRQARQLLFLLLRAAGRTDLLQCLGGSMGSGRAGIATPDGLRVQLFGDSGRGSRPGSAPPSRRMVPGAPEASPAATGTSAQRVRSGSPIPWPQPQAVAAADQTAPPPFAQGLYAAPSLTPRGRVNSVQGNRTARPLHISSSTLRIPNSLYDSLHGTPAGSTPVSPSGLPQGARGVVVTSRPLSPAPQVSPTVYRQAPLVHSVQRPTPTASAYQRHPSSPSTYWSTSTI